MIQCTVSKKDPQYASSDLEIFPDEFSKYAKFLNNYRLTKLFKVFVRPGDEYLIKLWGLHNKYIFQGQECPFENCFQK